jgi:hypothetical protein
MTKVISLKATVVTADNSRFTQQIYASDNSTIASACQDLVKNGYYDHGLGRYYPPNQILRVDLDT